MNTNWLNSSVKIIASICAISALTECVVDSDSDNGLQMVCGIATATSVFHMISSFLNEFFP